VWDSWNQSAEHDQSASKCQVLQLAHTLLGRPWTCDRLQRHHMQNNDDCAYSREVWFKLVRPTGFNSLRLLHWTRPTCGSLGARWCTDGFDSLVALICRSRSSAMIGYSTTQCFMPPRLRSGSKKRAYLGRSRLLVIIGYLPVVVAPCFACLLMLLLVSSTAS
jgi:hypothetical protein